MKQLQQQATHIIEIATKCKSKRWNKTLYDLDKHGIVYRMITDGPNIFYVIMVPLIFQPYILYESYNALGYNGSTRLYNFIKTHYYWKKLWQHHNKYVRSCPECQWVTLKEPHYVDLHLPIPHFLMSFISMDLLGMYFKTENRDQYTLSYECWLIISLCSHQIKKYRRGHQGLFKECVLCIWG